MECGKEKFSATSAVIAATGSNAVNKVKNRHPMKMDKMLLIVMCNSLHRDIA